MNQHLMIKCPLSHQHHPSSHFPLTSSVHKTATRVPGVQLNEDNTEVYDPYSVNNHPVPSLSNPEMGTSHSQFMVKDTYISVQANNIYFCSDPTISVLK